jgi:predicted Zn-dependent peptidase
MNDQSIHIFELANGLTLLVEEMRAVQSASFTIMTPAGAVYEPEGSNGTAAALCDLITRGAGSRTSRELSDALDLLGVQRSENVGWNFLSLSGATVAGNLATVLPIYAEILRRPILSEDQFPAVISGLEQGLLAEEDDPQRKALTELRRCCYDSPWNRPSDGSLDQLDQVTYEKILDHYRLHVRPNDTLIGVAGNVSAQQVLDVIENSFGDWAPKAVAPLQRDPVQERIRHLPHPSTQTHIGIAYRAVPYGHEDYYAAWGAVSVLSGGSSSRLFTEVREKRGLCYSVYAALNSLLTEGRVLAYAGTTTERAQETLDVMLHEMRGLAAGITPDELTRCLARAKSSLIMQQESTAARAGSIARDWFHLRRINTLSDVHRAIEGLTVDQLEDYARRYPAENVTLLTIGEQPLVISDD